MKIHFPRWVNEGNGCEATSKREKSPVPQPGVSSRWSPRTRDENRVTDCNLFVGRHIHQRRPKCSMGRQKNQMEIDRSLAPVTNFEFVSHTFHSGGRRKYGEPMVKALPIHARVVRAEAIWVTSPRRLCQCACSVSGRVENRLQRQRPTGWMETRGKSENHEDPKPPCCGGLSLRVVRLREHGSNLQTHGLRVELTLVIVSWRQRRMTQIAEGEGEKTCEISSGQRDFRFSGPRRVWAWRTRDLGAAGATR